MGKRFRLVRRRRAGLIPWTLGRLVSLGGWCVRHPQPFLLFVLVFAAAGLFWHVARRGEAFMISWVQVPEGAGLRVPSWVVGTNLWKLDLRALADDLHGQRPSLKAVRVTRRPPNTIVIDTVPRVPIAQVQLRAWHPVDAEGFVLPEGDPDGVTGLIRLHGVSTGQEPLRAGVVNRGERLNLALRVAERVRRGPGTLPAEIAAVDVAHPRDIRLTMAGGTEVRCGAFDELETHLSRLRATLKVLAQRPMRVRYIDVRFDEPVIEPRT